MCGLSLQTFQEKKWWGMSYFYVIFWILFWIAKLRGETCRIRDYFFKCTYLICNCTKVRSKILFCLFIFEVSLKNTEKLKKKPAYCTFLSGGLSFGAILYSTKLKVSKSFKIWNLMNNMYEKSKKAKITKVFQAEEAAWTLKNLAFLLRWDQYFSDIISKSGPYKSKIEAGIHSWWNIIW